MSATLVAYYRVSTRGQTESGLGLEAQRHAVQEHASRQGQAIVAEYTETESGKRSDRPELARALAHARRARATLVIAKLDRLSRNVHFLSGLMQSGVPFVCCDNPNATPLTLHILAAVAEDEALRISERTKAALAAYRARGGVLGTPSHRNPTMPAHIQKLGSQTGPAALARRAREAYADIAPRIGKLRESGLSLQAIADALNTDGYRTRTGAEFNKLTVHRILTRTQ